MSIGNNRISPETLAKQRRYAERAKSFWTPSRVDSFIKETEDACEAHEADSKLPDAAAVVNSPNIIAECVSNCWAVACRG